MNVSDSRDLGAFIPSVLDDYGLNPYEFRVYCHLARRAGRASTAWPSRKNLGQHTGMGAATAQRAMTVLEGAGMINRVGGGQSEGRPVEWQLAPPSEWAEAGVLKGLRQVARHGNTDANEDDREAGVYPQDTGGVSETTQGGVSETTHKGTPVQGHPKKGSVERDVEDSPYPLCSTDLTRTLARSLTRQLAEQVKANGHAIPKAGTSAVGGWLRTMERLVRAGPPGDVEWHDDPSEAADEIGKVAGWACGTSDFWPANVRSPDALARNYTTIRAQWRRDTAVDDAWRDNPAYDTSKLVV